MSDKKIGREAYLRERYLKVGAGGLMPKDALELLLSYCYKGQELYHMIDLLFEHYHNIANILNADSAELLEIPGMTESAAVLLGMIPRLYKLNTADRSAPSNINNAESACAYFLDQFRGVSVEQFKILCLDDKFKVIRCITAARGTTFGVDINAGDIINRVISSKCSICIIAHNHPGGSCMPSAADITSTEQLSDSMKAVGIELLDHIIIGRDGASSMFAQSTENGETYLRTE